MTILAVHKNLFMILSKVRISSITACIFFCGSIAVFFLYSFPLKFGILVATGLYFINWLFFETDFDLMIFYLLLSTSIDEIGI